MKLKSEEEIIIQSKIDGTLSAEEEKQFDNLIRSSEEARNLYNELAGLDQSLKHDAESIPVIDFSGEIMENVSTDVKTIKMTSVILKRWLSYAAVLAVGLFIGGLGVYVGTSSFDTPDVRQISGTMTKPSDGKLVYSKDGNEIEIQQTEYGKWKLLTVAVTSLDNIDIEITDETEKLKESDVSLALSSGKFDLKESRSGKLCYTNNGDNIFQINQTGISGKLKIRFVAGDKEIFNTEEE